MKSVIKKPHTFFFGLVPLCLIIGFFMMNKFINISILSLYFEVKLSILCTISAVFFGLIGGNYYVLFWANKPPKKTLTSIHLVLQILSLMAFFAIIFSVNTDGNISSNFLNQPLFWSISCFIFLISCFVHLINFFISLFLKTD